LLLGHVAAPDAVDVEGRTAPGCVVAVVLLAPEGVDAEVLHELAVGSYLGKFLPPTSESGRTSS
jgi:hypothetical protein